MLPATISVAPNSPSARAKASNTPARMPRQASGSVTRALGEFGATLMVAGSIPGKTQTLSIAVYEAVQAGQDELANVLVLMTSLTCVAVLLLAGRVGPVRIPGRS